RSEMRPAIGFTTTSHALGSRTSRPARPAAIPRVSVRYGSSNRPGTVPNAPVTRDPVAYPTWTRRDSREPLPGPLGSVMVAHAIRPTGSGVIREPAHHCPQL